MAHAVVNPPAQPPGANSAIRARLMAPGFGGDRECLISMDALIPKSFSCDTRRLRLRPLAEGDEALFHALYTDPETMRFIGAPLSLAEATSRFRAIIQRQGDSVFETRFLAIVAKNDWEPMGICGMSHYDPTTMQLEVGVMLLPEGRGQGVAREAMAALVRRIFDEQLVHQVCIRFLVGNAAMRSLAFRLGFGPDGAATGQGQDSTICRWSIRHSSWHAGDTINNQEETDVQCDRCS
jgi:RimJ/RimL family protein N-acetyltransferase